MDVVDRVKMGKRMREKRIKKKLTQERLSELVGISASHMGEIERGAMCSVDVLLSIANVLELNMDFLIRGMNEQNVDIEFSKKMELMSKDDKDRCIRLCDGVVEDFLREK